MKLLIYGAQNFAETVTALARDCGHEPIGCIDDSGDNRASLGSFEQVCKRFDPSDHGVAIAIGYNNLAARWSAWSRVISAGYQCPPLIHPRAYVATDAEIGDGAMLMAGALVDVRARVGQAVVMWPMASVNHDSVVGNNCFLSPQATVCGLVTVGPDSFIGAGAVVVDRCTLPQGSFVKAAGLVTTPRQL